MNLDSVRLCPPQRRYCQVHCCKLGGGAVPVGWHSETIRSAISGALISMTAFVICEASGRALAGQGVV